MAPRLIFNADDFGFARGVNDAIVDCHVGGVVTSTSLMVTGRAVDQAVELSSEHPGLAIGLHWDVLGEDERKFDTHDIAAVRVEFERQLEAFHRLLGRLPTHVDSHRHVHREEHLMPLFQELVEPLGVPLRCDGSVEFVGGFYAQWEWKVTNLEYVSVPFLERMIREEVRADWTEFSCHPGYVTPDWRAVYMSEREEEARTLTDPRVRAAVEAAGVELASYADYNDLARR